MCDIGELIFDQLHDLIEESLAVVVRPNDRIISKTKGFRNPDTYGELNPSFLTDLFSKVGLREQHLFLDLGSGVGNAVLQAALQTGCKARGCELSKVRNDFASPLHEELLERCKLESYKRRLRNTAAEERVKFVRGDKFKHGEVRLWVSSADLILVTNMLFTVEMNDELLLLAMVMKRGAKMATMTRLLSGTYEPGEQSPIERLGEESLQSRKGQAGWAWAGIGWYLYTKK